MKMSTVTAENMYFILFLLGVVNPDVQVHSFNPFLPLELDHHIWYTVPSFTDNFYCAEVFWQILNIFFAVFSSGVKKCL
jgi:hypothetical protein